MAPFSHGSTVAGRGTSRARSFTVHRSGPAPGETSQFTSRNRRAVVATLRGPTITRRVPGSVAITI